MSMSMLTPLTTRNSSHRRAKWRPLLSLLLPTIVAVWLSEGGIIATSSAFVVVSTTGVAINHRCKRNCNFYRQQRRSFDVPSALCIGNSDNNSNNENADLLETARRLREEASVLEDDLRAMPSTTSSSAAEATAKAAIVNTQLEGSIWTLSYRFSSQPAPDESNNNNNESPSPMRFYSGKINLLLKADGYSEQIVEKGNEKNNEMDIVIAKIWGWDRETSNEDDLDYLLFSMDIQFPEFDPELPNQKERYYFQAQIDQDTIKTGSGIALKEGTITVKKDVTEKTGGMWGFFNVAGILTQFRYCGDFVAKASR